MVLPNIPQGFQEATAIADYLYRKKLRNSTKNTIEKAIDTGWSKMISYPPDFVHDACFTPG
jgi:hypothetical protein